MSVLDSQTPPRSCPLIPSQTCHPNGPYETRSSNPVHTQGWQERQRKREKRDYLCDTWKSMHVIASWWCSIVIASESCSLRVAWKTLSSPSWPPVTTYLSSHPKSIGMCVRVGGWVWSSEWQSQGV